MKTTKTKTKSPSLLCISCDSYFPRYLGIELKHPATKPQPWLKGVVYTGKCHDCKETWRAFKRKMRGR